MTVADLKKLNDIETQLFKAIQSGRHSDKLSVSHILLHTCIFCILKVLYKFRR